MQKNFFLISVGVVILIGSYFITSTYFEAPRKEPEGTGSLETAEQGRNLFIKKENSLADIFKEELKPPLFFRDPTMEGKRSRVYSYRVNKTVSRELLAQRVVDVRVGEKTHRLRPVLHYS